LRKHLISLLLLFLASPAGSSQQLSEQAINTATPKGWSEGKKDHADPLIVRVQILLDRADISPGVIDGLPGDNLTKAIRAFEQREGIRPRGRLDDQFWTALSRDNAPVIQSYEISAKDVAQRFVDKIPDDFGEMSKLKWLGYTSPKEMIAERFHLDETLLVLLNPQADFVTAGTKILVPVVSENATEKVSHIVVDRSDGQVLAFAADRLVAAYPASIGSSSNPSPTGVHKVKAVVKDPTYSYDPKKNFQQGSNEKPLEIPPGPNGPVGTIWIDLTEPTYGIHGTAEPRLINKTESHGCVRLTNWDAQELANMVAEGVSVEFRD